MPTIGPFVLNRVQLFSTRNMDITQSKFDKRNIGIVLTDEHSEYFKTHGWKVKNFTKDDGSTVDVLYCDIEPGWNPDIRVYREGGEPMPITTMEDLDSYAKRIDYSAADLSLMGYVGGDGRVTAKVNKFFFHLRKAPELVHILSTRAGLNGHSPIKFSNFAGKETNIKGFMNRKGHRSCGIYIENEEQALALKALGWNIKEEAPYKDGDSTRYYTSIAVDYDHDPEPIVKRFREGMDDIPYDVDMLCELDEDVNAQNIEAIDVYLYPRKNTIGEYAYKGYLRELTFVVNSNPFSFQYNVSEDND